jgi:hypothetical protein
LTVTAVIFDFSKKIIPFPFPLRSSPAANEYASIIDLKSAQP